MKRILKTALLSASSLLCFGSLADDAAPKLDVLEPVNIFDIEYASGLDISRDGSTVYFVRQFMDIQTDRKLGNIWQVSTRDNSLLPVTTGNHVDYAPTLSPDGSRLAYISTESGKSQIHMRWLKTGHTAKLTNLTASPSNLVWSPDSKFIAFQMFVKGAPTNPVSLKGKPQGAKWADSAVFVDDVYYRFDGGGYGQKGSTEIFLLSAEGGTPRQLTDDEYNNNGGMTWSKDGKKLFFSANRHEDREFKPLNSDIYALRLEDNKITALTTRFGPDRTPKLSPDGKRIAFIGHDDRFSNYENNLLYIMNTDGSEVTLVSEGLDRSIDDFSWASNGRDIYVQYDDTGKSVLAVQSLTKRDSRKVLTDELGGQSYGRPYTQGEFVVSEKGVVAFTLSDPQRPADVAAVVKGKVKQLTHLNDDALGHKDLANIEEIWFSSGADGKKIQGWIAYPPGFDKTKKYPLVLEIHGGPVTAYGPHFSMEVQLFAAAGNVVLYTNPRGSSSYGKAFANTIDKNYPSQDFDDLMSGVDAVVAKGFIDTDKLFVTGGSGGGVLTAWTVAHTKRFAAAVVAKPVINWYSFVLTADFYPFFYQYWFGKKPWEDLEGYMKYSPISYVGNVTTPTMLLTGESDYRTPISETEQYYQALKIQKVDTAMVRIPGASHGIYRRPSNLMSKVEYILWWFDKYSEKKDTNEVNN